MGKSLPAEFVKRIEGAEGADDSGGAGETRIILVTPEKNRWNETGDSGETGDSQSSCEIPEERIVKGLTAV